MATTTKDTPGKNAGPVSDYTQIGKRFFLTFSDSMSSMTKMPSWVGGGTAAGRTALTSGTSLVVEVSLDWLPELLGRCFFV